MLELFGGVRKELKLATVFELYNYIKITTAYPTLYYKSKGKAIIV